MSIKMPWFRMYTDFLNDPKMIALAFEDQRHFIGILALKSDGAIDDSADENLLNRIVAQRLWIDHGVIRDVKKRLHESGLIDSNWQPVAWGKRQFISDRDSTATERKRRERLAKATKNNVTDMSRVTGCDDLKNVTRLETDTETDTDKEEDKERETAPAKRSPTTRKPSIDKPDGVTDQTWGDWLSLRKAKKAPVTQTVIDGAVSEAQEAHLTLEAFLKVWCQRGSQGLQAAWLKDSERTATSAPKAMPLSFAQRDRIEGMQRWEESCNRRHPDLPAEYSKFAQAANVIDITPNQTRLSQ